MPESSGTVRISIDLPNEPDAYVHILHDLILYATYQESFDNDSQHAADVFSRAFESMLYANLGVLWWGGDMIPIGLVAPFAGSAAPDDWLICDGSAISRTTYSELYAVTGDAFGTGDGSTTFNLPDMRGRVAGGSGSGSGLTTRAIGNEIGAETHQLSQSEIAAYNLELPVKSSNGSTFIADPFGPPPGNPNQPGTNAEYFPANGGGDTPHNNMQPTLFMNWIIYAGGA